MTEGKVSGCAAMVCPWRKAVLIGFGIAVLWAFDLAGQEAGTQNGTADDGLDSLFNDSGDSVVQDTGNPLERVEEVLGIRFSGSFEAKAAAFLGVRDFSDAQDGSDSWLDNGGGFDLDMTLGFRADSTVDLGVAGAFSFSYPSFSLVTESIYFDYVLAHTLYIRGGKFTETWGMGTFYNQADIIPDAAVSLRLKLPVDPLGLTLIVQATPEWFNDTDNPGLTELDYGLRADLRFSGAEIQGGVAWHKGTWTGSGTSRTMTPEPLRTSLGTRFSLLGFDLFAEGQVDFPVDEADLGDLPAWRVNAGLFYEIADPRIQISAEYLHDSREAEGSEYVSGPDNRSILALRIPDLGSGIQLGLSWAQSWDDWSALVLGGLSIPLDGVLKLNILVWGRLGEDGTLYRSADLTSDQDIPGQELGLMLGVSLKAPF